MGLFQLDCAVCLRSRQKLLGCYAYTLRACHELAKLPAVAYKMQHILELPSLNSVSFHQLHLLNVDFFLMLLFMLPGFDHPALQFVPTLRFYAPCTFRTCRCSTLVNVVSAEQPIY